jgi:hypothetical protein
MGKALSSMLKPMPFMRECSADLVHSATNAISGTTVKQDLVRSPMTHAIPILSTTLGPNVHLVATGLELQTIWRSLSHRV